MPEAQITGVEADFTVRPSENFQFGASVNYTNAPLYQEHAVGHAAAGPDQYLQLRSFRRRAQVQRHHLRRSLSAPLGGDTGRLTLRGDLYSQTKMNFSNVGDTVNPNSTLPGYTLVNARLTLVGDHGQAHLGIGLVAQLCQQALLCGRQCGTRTAATQYRQSRPAADDRGGELRFEF